MSTTEALARCINAPAPLAVVAVPQFCVATGAVAGANWPHIASQGWSADKVTSRPSSPYSTLEAQVRGDDFCEHVRTSMLLPGMT